MLYPNVVTEVLVCKNPYYKIRRHEVAILADTFQKKRKLDNTQGLKIQSYSISRQP